MFKLSGFTGTPKGHLGGYHVQALEHAFCEYFNVSYAVALNSATSGLHASLIASQVGIGDEVVVSPYSFSSSASCALIVGATPKFADIDEDTFNIFTQSGTEQAYIPVHLFGHPAKVYSGDIEDCAQAIGATRNGKKVGTIGSCGVFSFNQSKHINTGEGGILITDDADFARVVRAVRNHGEVADPELGIVGYNYRMLESVADSALKQFKTLDRDNAHRIERAEYMTERLSEIEEITPPVTMPNCTHVYYMYAMKFKGNRDLFLREMQGRGWPVYPYVEPLHKLPIYGEQPELPVVEKVSKEVMVINWVKPLEHIDKFVEDAKEVINGNRT